MPLSIPLSDDASEVSRRFKDLTPEEQRIYNRAIKRRSRESERDRVEKRLLPRTQEAFLTLLALAAADIASENHDQAKEIAKQIERRMGRKHDPSFSQEILLRCLRITTKFE